jgi:RNA ligase (TIGR02306 family)
MATWKVSREQMELFPHPKKDVEKLELGRLGDYQVVVGKGIFKNGQSVIFVPSRSILPDNIADEGDRRKYLTGQLKNKVKSIRLQGELSCGIILDDKEELKDIPFGTDISEKLGISEYIAPIPAQLAGKIDKLDIGDINGKYVSEHDVYGFLANIREFNENEVVYAFEKIHGSQFIGIVSSSGNKYISSKGLIKRSQTLKEEENNTYWAGARNSKIFDLIDKYYPNQYVQIFGEVVPCQKGFNYGQQKPKVLLFKIEVNNKIVKYSEIPEEIKKTWVPLIYNGPFNKEKLFEVRNGKEQVSGKELHIKEGIVISPEVPRRDSNNNHDLMIKLLNIEYKETGEEFS